MAYAKKMRMNEKHNSIPMWQLVAVSFLIGAVWLYAMAVIVNLPALFATWHYAAASLGLIAMGLVVPYLALKLLMHIAHRINPNERELHLRDIPKDQEQLNRIR